MKESAKDVLKLLGFELIRRRPHGEDLLTANAVDVVIDVGANDGLYGRFIRAAGYRGRIVSFEPLRSTFDLLKAQAAKDPLWETINAGLGRENGVQTISIARRSVFSSILQPLPSLKNFASADVEAVGQEQLTMNSLDTVFSRFVRPREKAFLKVDTQGYEKEVILGAEESLASIWGVQLELSLKPLYQGEASFAEMIAMLEKRGFHLGLIDPVTYDRAKGVLLQADCVFLKDARDN